MTDGSREQVACGRESNVNYGCDACLCRAHGQNSIGRECRRGSASVDDGISAVGALLTVIRMLGRPSSLARNGPAHHDWASRVQGGHRVELLAAITEAMRARAWSSF